MLAIGFDPVFIDTVVRVETSDGNLIDTLPPPGFHHRQNSITRIAGGNGVNIAYVLKKLGHDVDLIIPSNPLFDELLQDRELECTYRIHNSINETVALSWSPGEIQFNEVKSELSLRHFSKEIFHYWDNTQIQLSLNWGLNPTSVEWISALWLTSCGWTFDEIQEVEMNLQNHAIEEIDLQTPLILEPGSIAKHHNKSSLHQLLKTMSNSRYQEIYPILSVNEEENVEFNDYQFPSYIVHTSESVSLRQSTGIIERSVPELENIDIFVGAGDAFIAGIVSRLIYTDKIHLDYGIEIAQEYMRGNIQ